jgi:hypothetical protein
MGRTGSGKSHPISKSLQTNASPGSMKIEPGLFVFASSCFVPHLKTASLTYSFPFMSKRRMKTRLDSAAYSAMPADSSVLTVECKINLVAPADGERLIARGEFCVRAKL